MESKVAMPQSVLRYIFLKVVFAIPVLLSPCYLPRAVETDFRIVRADSGVLYVVTVTQPATEQVVFQRRHVKRHIAGGAIRVEMSIDHAQEQRMSRRFNNLDRVVPELCHAFYRRPSRLGTRRWHP